MKWVQEMIVRVGEDRKPVLDLDDDMYSPYPGLRGSSWRGRDCSDTDNNIYPGRRRSTSPASVDHNCNGIAGFNERGQPYEDLFCSGANSPRGVIVIGDSASANFYVPIIGGPDGTVSKFVETALNEGDSPQCSWATGHAKNEDCPIALWPKELPEYMQSFYMRLRQRNRCNHRDYQNISVNGARSGAVASKFVKAIARNHTSDAPVIVFLSMFANDVCSPHAGEKPMTTPEQFHTNIRSILDQLDAKLPANSYVFATGKSNGELMYEKMGKKMHPNLNMTYEHIWDYIGCLGSNSCWGWLNKNETWRRFTTDRAQALNAVYPRIVAQQAYKNFRFEYLGSFFKSNMEYFEAQGLDPKYMFQPIDGGHPGQSHQNLKGKNVFETIERRFPQALGAINPHNAEIERIFGDQKGH